MSGFRDLLSMSGFCDAFGIALVVLVCPFEEQVAGRGPLGGF